MKSVERQTGVQATVASANSAPYWAIPAPEVLEALGTTALGLGSEEAEARLRRFGPNRVRERDGLSASRLLLGQFRSPLVLILVVATMIALLVGDWLDAAIVLIIVLASAALGFVQEYRASSAVGRLRARIALRTTVSRDGRLVSVPTDAIVPGDVVVLSAGSLIPADGILLEARDFFVNQALLTGESLPVEKQVGTGTAEAPLIARRNCVFMGTSVRSGTARAMIVTTGRGTEMGAIAERLVRRPPETDFERGLRHFGFLLARIAIVLVLAVFAAHVFFHRPTIDSLLFAIALAVGLSPELLPAILTVTLARGANDMARSGVIVRRLNAIESLGSMDVLCTDKTGTLTAGVIRVDASVDPAGRPSDMVLRDAFVNASLQTGLANPLDEAVIAVGSERGCSTKALEKIDEIPYDFARKRMSVVVQESGQTPRRMITKGAVQEVLSVCRTMLLDGVETALDGAERARLDRQFRDWSTAGYRVLAVAIRMMPSAPAYTRGDENGMVLIGFLLCMDPPDPDAAQTLRDLARLHVAVKIITGDNRYVAAHVAEAVGLANDSLITGEALNAMGDEALWHRAPRAQVFAEVDPNQKERIIDALRKTGHVVGYLGDGINDAPALHAADVGISVDKAVDVAKEAADLVLLSHDLDILRRGVEQGRHTFANTIKYIFVTTSANFGNMVSMALASLFLPFLPLLAKQILLNNFLSDIPSVFIAGDNVDREWLRKPYHWDIKSIGRFMVIFGLLSTLFDLLTFAALLRIAHGDTELFRTGWFMESLLTELAVMLVIRTYQPFYRSRPGIVLLLTTMVMFPVTLLLPYLPLATLFDFVPLPGSIVAMVLVITAGYIAATEVVKRRFHRRLAQKRATRLPTP